MPPRFGSDADLRRGGSPRGRESRRDPEQRCRISLSASAGAASSTSYASAIGTARQQSAARSLGSAAGGCPKSSCPRTISERVAHPEWQALLLARDGHCNFGGPNMDHCHSGLPLDCHNVLVRVHRNVRARLRSPRFDALRCRLHSCDLQALYVPVQSSRFVRLDFLACGSEVRILPGASRNRGVALCRWIALFRAGGCCSVLGYDFGQPRDLRTRRHVALLAGVCP